MLLASVWETSVVPAPEGVPEAVARSLVIVRVRGTEMFVDCHCSVAFEQVVALEGGKNRKRDVAVDEGEADEDEDVGDGDEVVEDWTSSLLPSLSPSPCFASAHDTATRRSASAVTARIFVRVVTCLSRWVSKKGTQ